MQKLDDSHCAAGPVGACIFPLAADLTAYDMVAGGSPPKLYIVEIGLRERADPDQRRRARELSLDVPQAMLDRPLNGPTSTPPGNAFDASHACSRRAIAASERLRSTAAAHLPRVVPGIAAPSRWRGNGTHLRHTATSGLGRVPTFSGVRP